MRKLRFFLFSLVFTASVFAAPRVNEGVVVNGASFMPAPVAAGSIVSVFGTELAASVAYAGSIPLTTDLAGTRVFVNNIPAPLFYVSPEQVNFQIPWEVGNISGLTVQVSLDGVLSNAISLELAPAAPGIFSLTQDGKGQGVVISKGHSWKIAGPPSIANAEPVNPVDVISIFCTGLGAVSNVPRSGEAASAVDISETTLPVSVEIGGVDAEVLFSGLAPGFVGLYQVNAVVPRDAPQGEAIPLVVEVGGVLSNVVTIAISEALPWTRFFANPVREAEARTVVIDNDGRAIVSFQEKIPGTDDTAAGIVVLDRAGNVVSIWNSAAPSEITGMGYVPEDDVFWAAGTIGGDSAHPELRQAWLLKFRNSVNPETVLDKRFQFSGKRTEVKTLQIAHGKIWLGVETDDVFQEGIFLTNMQVLVLDFVGNVVKSFGVGWDFGSNTLIPKPLMRLFVAQDHIWHTQDGYFGQAVAISYILRKYTLDGRSIGSPITSTNKFGVEPIEDKDGNFYVGGTRFGITVATINNRLFNLDRRDKDTQELLSGDPVWDGDNSGPVSVNIVKNVFANPSGGVVLVSSLSRIGSSDLSMTDGGAAAWDIRDGRHVKIWTRRDGDVAGGSIFSWNSGVFTSDGYLVLVGSGTDGRSDCGHESCRTAAIMRIRP